MVLTHLVAFGFHSGASGIANSFAGTNSLPPYWAFNGFTETASVANSFGGYNSLPPYWAFNGFTDFTAPGLNQAPGDLDGVGQRGVQNFPTEEEEIALVAGEATITGVGLVNSNAPTGTGSLVASAAEISGVGVIVRPAQAPQLITIELSEYAVTTITLTDTAI